MRHAKNISLANSDAHVFERWKRLPIDCGWAIQSVAWLAIVSSFLGTHFVTARIASAQTEGQVTYSVRMLEDEWSVDKLQKIQTAVKQVVSKASSACVGIDDGLGVGTGVIVSPDGLILTAAHVMSTEQETYEVLFPDGRTAKARVLGRNLDVDAGMMKLESGTWPYVEIGQSDALKKGDWVVSIGHSGGFELGRKPPVRTGRLLERNGHQLVTDAILIGGDSGGPLFDTHGKLIGIHSSMGDLLTINRHVKIEQFKQDWDRLRAGKTWGQLSDLAEPPIGKAQLGVRVDLVTPKAKIKLIKPGSPAARSGLAEGDIVIGFDGEMITDGRHLIRAVQKKIPRDTYFITVLRNDQTFQFEVRLD